MLNKIIKISIILLLLYQPHLYSKSISFDNFDSKDLSNYFSGIVASENQNNSEALKFFNSSKVLMNQHSPYLQNYITSLVLENKVSQAINIIKINKNKDNTNFLAAYLLLILDNLKKNNIDQAYENLNEAFKFVNQDRFNLAILETLKQYVLVFRDKKIKDQTKNYGNLTFIAETFQRCYLDDPKTKSYFLNLINKNEADYTRYIYFYLSYLTQKKNFKEAKEIASTINYISSTLLLSQGKNWIKNENFGQFQKVFSCQNHNHIISEFLFLISNLYSSQDDFESSNFYLYLSNFLNPKFIYNLSLAAENHFLNENYIKSKKILFNFKKNDVFYYWYRIKKETQIIAKEKSVEKSLNFMISEFNKLKHSNNKFIYDIANFYKNSKDYETAIKYYTQVINNIDNNLEIKSDILYRRGGSYERKGDYHNADKDLLESLSINPDDAYVLNYLAYSWLERDYKIDEALQMLEVAYASESDDPYIIDSIGWAYYLVADYQKLKNF